jgi:thiol-disulfide isomerase/thioredoxin
MRSGAALVVVLAILALAPAARAREAAPEEPVFAALDGRYVHVSDHRGHVVVLEFWATWCGACASLVPVINRLHEQLGPKGVHVVGASANARDEAEPVRRYMAAHGMKHEVWLWASAKDMRAYGVGPGIPAIIVFDKAGAVRARFQGIVEESRLRAAIEPLLAQPDLAGR